MCKGTYCNIVMGLSEAKEFQYNIIYVKENIQISSSWKSSSQMSYGKS